MIAEYFAGARLKCRGAQQYGSCACKVVYPGSRAGPWAAIQRRRLINGGCKAHRRCQLNEGGQRLAGCAAAAACKHRLSYARRDLSGARKRRKGKEMRDRR